MKTMRIRYANRGDEALFNDAKKLVRKYGAENAKLIMVRLDELRDATALSDVSPLPPPRRHKLSGRDNEYAVSVRHPFRLVFSPDMQSIGCEEDGSYDIRHVYGVVILRIEDYHGN